jgi:uncharacterized protein YehS (DUF1456 family)
MNNNDIIRRLRYTFDFSDAEMISICGQVNYSVSRALVSDWLKKDDNEEQIEMKDVQLASFLNGLIIEKRGKREGPQPVAEDILTNNAILRKLKIALNLREDGMLAIFKLGGMDVSKHELSAFFRKPTQNQYRVCQDQFLRVFLHGMQIKYRDGSET